VAVEQAALSNKTPDEQWPAVALAFEFVRPSYELSLKRFEVVEGRIRSLVTLTASLTFGAPVLLRAAWSVPPSFDSPVFVAAMACAAVILVVGTLAFAHARVTTYDPERLAEASTRFTAFEFRRIALKLAGEANRANDRRLEWRGRAADLMAWVLLIEFALLTTWALTAPSVATP
jgi:hypothetical protein